MSTAAAARVRPAAASRLSADESLLWVALRLAVMPDSVLASAGCCAAEKTRGPGAGCVPGRGAGARLARDAAAAGEPAGAPPALLRASLAANERARRATGSVRVTAGTRSPKRLSGMAAPRAASGDAAGADANTGTGAGAALPDTLEGASAAAVGPPMGDAMIEGAAEGDPSQGGVAAERSAGAGCAAATVLAAAAVPRAERGCSWNVVIEELIRRSLSSSSHCTAPQRMPSSHPLQFCLHHETSMAPRVIDKTRRQRMQASRHPPHSAGRFADEQNLIVRRGQPTWFAARASATAFTEGALSVDAADAGRPGATSAAV